MSTPIDWVKFRDEEIAAQDRRARRIRDLEKESADLRWQYAACANVLAVATTAEEYTAYLARQMRMQVAT